MNYSNLPVYIKQQNPTVEASGVAYNYIVAQNASIEYQAQNDASRLLGVAVNADNQFSNGAPLQAKINFNCYINTDSGTSGALADILNSSGENSYSIRVGNNVYDECYLSNYDVSVQPFQPVFISASYAVNQAPKINLNQQEFIPVTTLGSSNQLLYSESLTGENYIYTNLAATTGQPDATGGNAATLISGQTGVVSIVDYSLDNNDVYTYSSITGAGSGTALPALASNNDVSVAVSFTGGKTFIVGNDTYSQVQISNNGIISFDVSDTGYSSSESDDFPIDSPTRKFIAAYWRKMAAGTGGSILYKQETDKFIIEYAAVNATDYSQPQTYQIHLFFATGNIEIQYQSVAESLIFTPNATIGIQFGPDQFINYNLALVDTSKSLKFTRLPVDVAINPNFVYSAPITPNQLRTFSIHLKRSVGSGDIKYTLNGGVEWEVISPALVSGSYTRYTFSPDLASQQIGIQVSTVGDAILIYGAQLEPLGYATNYIPTSGTVGIRDDVTENVAVDFFAVDLSTGFANTMINGDNCSVSSTTGFVSSIQSSIRYSVNCDRAPVYSIGDTNASRYILDTVEKQMDISSTNLASFIDFSGSRLTSDLNLTLKDAQDYVSSVISMKSGANIFSQQTNIQEGDTIVTQVSIKEIIV